MPEQKNMDKQLVILKLVAAAIVSGVLVFWIVVVALMSARPPEPKLVLPFMLILLVLVVPAVVVPIVVRRLFVKETRRSLAASSVGADLAQIVAARLLLYTIVSMAGAELLGFVAAAGYMLTKHQAMMGVGGFAVILLLRQFPTQGRYRRFLEEVASPNAA